MTMFSAASKEAIERVPNLHDDPSSDEEEEPEYKTPLDLLEYDLHAQLVVKIPIDHAELGMTPLPLVIS